MNQVTLHVEGMASSMCEAHVNEAVRKAVPGARNVKSSHKKGVTEFVTETEVDEAALRRAIGETGYTVQSVQTAPYRKRGLFGL